MTPEERERERDHYTPPCTKVYTISLPPHPTIITFLAIPRIASPHYTTLFYSHPFSPQILVPPPTFTSNLLHLFALGLFYEKYNPSSLQFKSGFIHELARLRKRYPQHAEFPGGVRHFALSITEINTTSIQPR